MGTSVSRSEWRWLMAVSLAILLLSSLPTLYAWSLESPDRVFTGSVYNVEDANSYLGKMRLGARGEWLFYLFYTPEPHEPILVYPFYLFLGKLAAGLGTPLPLAYHLSRVLFGFGLLVTIYVFVAYFTPDLTHRRLAWFLCAIGSGLGWLLLMLGAVPWLGSLPLDFWVPEAYTFLVLYSTPHLALAQGLLLLVVLLTLRGFEKDARWSLVAAGLAFAMGWVVPFYAGVLAAAIAAYLLAMALRRQHFPWRELGLATVTGLGAVPPIIYIGWSFAKPVYAEWAAQNRILSPHPAHYLLGFGLLIVPAAWGAVHAWRQGGDRWLLPLAWVLVVPFLLYLPFNLQRRMCVAVQVPLALLAAVGLLARLRGKPMLRLGYVLLVGLSNWLLIAGSLGPIRQRTEPIFRSGAEVAALRWLNRHASPEETVLASFQVGNVVPVYTDLRVFAGHGPETLYSAQKGVALTRFFEPETDDEWRQNLLTEYGIDYVFYGPHELALGTWEPAHTPYLFSVYDEAGYVIFRVLADRASVAPTASCPQRRLASILAELTREWPC